MLKKKIAVRIQSEVQFFSLEPVICKLKSIYEVVDVVYDDFKDDASGYREMAVGVKRLIKKAGYEVLPLTAVKEKIYDVYLTPYIDGIVKAKCYLKFEYGTLNIKPNLTYIPSVMERFHGFLCQNTITNELLKVYGATFPVDNLRFYQRKKVVGESKKKIVLFAPTYNDQDDVSELVSILKTLKKKYYVLVKGHHGTDYLKENSEKRHVLEELADEYYGSETCLSDLILKADVCLFGNSSAIGEALFAKVPCAIFAKDLDCFKMGKVHTTQYQFVKKGYIPYTDKAEKVNEIIDQALTSKNIKIQEDLADEIFPQEYRTGVDGYIKVIKYFASDALAKDYVMLHDAVMSERKRELTEGAELANRLREENERLAAIIDEQEAILKDNEKKKLYKFADKIYKIEGKIRNVKN